MKKALATMMMIGAAAVSAHALSFNWGMGAVRAQFPTGAYVTDGSVTGYLIYLGSSAGATWNINGYGLDNSVVDSKASTSTGSPALMGRITDAFDDHAYGGAIGDGSDVFGNGSTFGMFLTYTDGSGVEWFNLSATKYTVAGAVNDGSVLSAANFAFDFTQNARGDALVAGGGWAAAPVPEPGTAALALAGLALLIRRRK